MTIGTGTHKHKIVLDKCPANFITPDHLYALKMFTHYKDGFLPYPGGIANQPAALILAIQVIRGEYNLIEEKKAKKHAKRKGK